MTKPLLRRGVTHGFTKTILDRFQDSCKHHTGWSDWLSLLSHAPVMKCCVWECACGKAFVSSVLSYERGANSVSNFLRATHVSTQGEARSPCQGGSHFPPDGLCYVMLCYVMLWESYMLETYMLDTYLPAYQGGTIFNTDNICIINKYV